jgi:hypothetical protein
LQERGE